MLLLFFCLWERKERVDLEMNHYVRPNKLIVKEKTHDGQEEDGGGMKQMMLSNDGDKYKRRKPSEDREC